MKTTLLSTLILLVQLTTFSELQAQSASYENEIQDFTRSFMAAYNQQDQEALQEMYLEDAVRIDLNGKEFKGADEIAQYFTKQFIENNTTLLLRASTISWSDFEHAWLAKGTYEIYGNTHVYNIKINESGAYAHTMIKKDGEWKIAKTVLSPLPSQLVGGSSPGNIVVIDNLYQSFANGDIPNVLAAMDSEIVWNEAEGFPYSDRNPYVGPDAVLKGVFARIGAEWEYWNLTDIQLHEMSGNMVLATLRYKAEHKETGKVIDSQTAHLWTLKDGKIVGFQQYTDTKQAAEAIH